MATTLSLSPEKASFLPGEDIVLIYSHTLHSESAPFTGSADFGSGSNVAVTGTALIQDTFLNYDAPVIDGYTFAVDPANPARWIGTKNA